MTNYKTLFEQAHTTPLSTKLQDQTYPISPFPRTDLFMLYIRTRNIPTTQLRSQLENHIDNPFHLDHQAHRAIMYVFPAEITDQFPKAQQLQEQHWQQHALFIRGATNIHLKQVAQDKIRTLLIDALDEIAAQTIYKHNISWRADLAHKLLDPHDFLQQHDQELAKLEYQER